MPVEPSSRRQSRKSATNDEDIEARRSRGEISCAECRRLKLKCDKKIPCSSCIRRGCQSICPTGSLATGQGTRFVLADTGQLHSKIAEMGQRIRQLEDALTIFQSGVSNDVHPLLTTEQLAIKFGPENVQDQEPRVEPSLTATMDALGTLTVGENGGARFFGRSAGAETLLFAGAEHEDAKSSAPPLSLSIEVARLSNAFPFGESFFDGDAFFHLLRPHFPEQMRAWALCETYFEQFAWSFSPLRRDELVDEYMSPVYKFLKEGSSEDPPASITPHKCAVLFIVFCIGSWVDLTLEDYISEADKYYHLTRACLSMRSAFDSPEISTVLAISLLSVYHGLEGSKFTMDSGWTLLSLASKLAQSLGLHRDSARWNMDPLVIERRRHLFWELFSNEMFYCIGLGRPPSIRLSYIDTELPSDVGIVDPDGSPLVGFYRWKHEFVKECYSDVIEATLTAIPPKYDEILDLDRRIRQKPLPLHLNTVHKPDEDQYVSPRVYFQSNVLGQYRSVILVYLHRSFFAQALLDHPINPLRSPYAPSFLAAYRCASWLIKGTTSYYERYPDLASRLWHPWTHLFSSAIIVGSIVTHATTSSLADNAFVELEMACDVYEKGVVNAPSPRVRTGWRILQSLRSKARDLYSQHRSGMVAPPKGLTINTPNYGEDELALFGGQTRILVSKHLSHRPRSSAVRRQDQTSASTTHSPPSNTPSPASSSGTGSDSSDPLKDVHPALVDYLNTAPTAQFAAFNTQGISNDIGIFDAEMAQLNQPFDFSGWQHPSQTFQDATGQGQAMQDPVWPMPYPSTSTTGEEQLLSMLTAQTSPPNIHTGAMNDQWQSFMQGSGFFPT
ncbi:fungal-specific transcription factor domain-containing protein [Flagelloscypha sp. PMI_526]|nr:fungal-specific transcription factor domain-containing protein [Flagelloscypha sp. PMI_526]